MENKNIIAVDLGASNLRVALVTDSGEILKISKTPTIHDSAGIILKQIIDEINSLINEEEMESALGIGISVAGPISINEGSVVLTNFNNKHVFVTEPIKKEFNKKVVLMNDANAAALAEKYYGLGRETDNLVYITISTGIGAGAIVDGSLLLGEDGSAGEAGHFNIDGQYNLLCGCGGVNHWEAYSSGKNIPIFFKAWAEKNNYSYEKDYSDVFKIFNEVNNNDELALKFMNEYGKINAKGIANIIAAYDPELIILGGGVSINNPEIIIGGIINNSDNSLKLPEIKVTELGDGNSLLGIAAATIHSRQDYL